MRDDIWAKVRGFYDPKWLRLFLGMEEFRERKGDLKLACDANASAPDSWIKAGRLHLVYLNLRSWDLKRAMLAHVRRVSEGLL